MSNVKLQTLVNNVDEANCKLWRNAYDAWVIRLGYWVYRLALRGNLYTKNPKGEMVQIKIRRGKHG
jgi:hypothetical protein